MLNIRQAAGSRTTGTTYECSAVVSYQRNAIVKQQITIVFDQVSCWIDIAEDGTTEKLESVKGDIPDKPGSAFTCGLMGI